MHLTNYFHRYAISCRGMASALAQISHVIRAATTRNILERRILLNDRNRNVAGNTIVARALIFMMDGLTPCTFHLPIPSACTPATEAARPLWWAIFFIAAPHRQNALSARSYDTIFSANTKRTLCRSGAACASLSAASPLSVDEWPAGRADERSPSKART